MPLIEPETPRKILPPPTTIAISAPSCLTLLISSARVWRISRSMPYFCLPPKTSPESFKRTRLYAGLAMSERLYYNFIGMTMFFPYFELAASLFVLLFSYHIWTRHHENRAARFFSRFATVAFLACIFTYSFRIAFTLEIAQDINRIAATLIAFSFSIFAHFALIFARKETFIRKP